MPNIFHGIDVSIDIHIAVVCVYDTHECRIIIHLHTSTLLYRTLFLTLYPIVYLAIIN